MMLDDECTRFNIQTRQDICYKRQNHTKRRNRPSIIIEIFRYIVYREREIGREKKEIDKDKDGQKREEKERRRGRGQRKRT